MVDTLYQYTFCFHPLFIGIRCILYSKLLFIWHRLSPFHGRGQKVITWTMYIPHFRQYSCTQYMCPKSSINLSTMRKRQETIRYAFIAFILALKNPKFLLIHLISDQVFFFTFLILATLMPIAQAFQSPTKYIVQYDRSITLDKRMEISFNAVLYLLLQKIKESFFLFV